MTGRRQIIDNILYGIQVQQISSSTSTLTIEENPFNFTRRGGVVQSKQISSSDGQVGHSVQNRCFGCIQEKKVSSTVVDTFPVHAT